MRRRARRGLLNRRRPRPARSCRPPPAQRRRSRRLTTKLPAARPAWKRDIPPSEPKYAHTRPRAPRANEVDIATRFVHRDGPTRGIGAQNGGVAGLAPRRRASRSRRRRRSRDHDRPRKAARRMQGHGFHATDHRRRRADRRRGARRRADDDEDRDRQPQGDDGSDPQGRRGGRGHRARRGAARRRHRGAQDDRRAVADPGHRRHPLQPHAGAQGDRRRRALHPPEPRQHRRARQGRRGRRSARRRRARRCASA